MNWTDEQETAIAARKCNLLVSAAAGSGKTALLIERIRRLVVEDKVPVEDLLVLTFTRAAAGEMKERLNRALVGAFEATGADAKWLLAQIQKLPAADISTIHAFCGHLVREYFQEVGVDPQFKMGEETQLAI